MDARHLACVGIGFISVWHSKAACQGLFDVRYWQRMFSYFKRPELIKAVKGTRSIWVWNNWKMLGRAAFKSISSPATTAFRFLRALRFPCNSITKWLTQGLVFISCPLFAFWNLEITIFSWNFTFFIIKLYVERCSIVSWLRNSVSYWLGKLQDQTAASTDKMKMLKMPVWW